MGLPRVVTPCCTSCCIEYFPSLTFWVQSWSHYTHHTVGKCSKLMCSTLVCIISFLAYTLIIKYLRGRVEEIEAKKVPLRLKLTIIQLLKSLSSLYIRDVARFFALLSIFMWKDFHKAVLITRSNLQIDMYANKNCSDSKSKNLTLKKF